MYEPGVILTFCWNAQKKQTFNFPITFFSFWRFLFLSNIEKMWNTFQDQTYQQKKLEKSFFLFFSKSKEQVYFQCYVTLFYQTQHIWNCFQKHTWHTWHIPLTLILYFAFFFLRWKARYKTTTSFFSLSCKMWRQAQVVM